MYIAELSEVVREPATCKVWSSVLVAKESLQIRRGKLDEGLKKFPCSVSCPWHSRASLEDFAHSHQ